jgi:hypothetical protein
LSERVKARPQSILQDRNILSLPRVAIDAGSPAKPVSFEPSRKPGVRCAIAADEPAYRYPTVGIAGCCARAALGHAAAPPSVARNFRRLMWLAI